MNKNYVVGAVLIAIAILFVIFTGCIYTNQTKEYTGILIQSSYPKIAEVTPMCLVWVLKTNTTSYYLTQNKTPVCGLNGDFNIGDNVVITGYVHYLKHYHNSEEWFPPRQCSQCSKYQCLEILEIK